MPYSESTRELYMLSARCKTEFSVQIKKGYIFDGAALSHSSIKVKENKHEFMVIFHTVEGK